MPSIVGVDVGGTFTDFLSWQDGAIRLHKRPSTPDDPARAVLEGLDALGVTPDLVVHGSTVATNAVLERRGARTALVTTKGFRDLLAIGRQTRPDIYDLEPETPDPLVPAELLLEFSGRLRPDGTLDAPPDAGEATRLLDLARERGAAAVAVSLLYAYANPALERGFEAAASDLFVSLSSEVSREYREVERTATTVLNAYVGPVMSRYLEGLERSLRTRGVSQLRVVRSDGGAAGARRASRLPVSTLLSGPSAGVQGAFALARQAGHNRIITLDMGGTSTDVALCDGSVPTRADVVVGDVAARTPVVDVHTVGAGGGSIARLDAGGALRVGPRSAGADPGPACYGRGTEFTVTDAHAVLGRLGAHTRLGGSLALDLGRAEAAARPLLAAFPDERTAASAVIDVVTANMERALRVVSVQRGHDPREFTLVPFGGAGPLHACALADALEIPRILVPLMPGVLAAVGAAQTDLTASRVRSVLLPFATDSLARVEQALARAADEAREALEGDPDTVDLALDLRYEGQSYELTIPVLRRHVPEAAEAFHAEHERRFAHADRSATVEVVNVRAVARMGDAPAMPPTTFAHAGERRQRARVGIWWRDRQLEADIVPRDALVPGDRIEGPAVVTQVDCTTLVESGWRAEVDPHGNLEMTRP